MFEFAGSITSAEIESDWLRSIIGVQVGAGTVILPPCGLSTCMVFRKLVVFQTPPLGVATYAMFLLFGSMTTTFAAAATGLPCGSMPSIWPPVVVNGPTAVQSTSFVSAETTPEKPVEVMLG